MVWGYANPLIFSSHRFANISHINYQSQRIRLVTVVSWIQEPRYDGQIGGYSCSDISRCDGIGRAREPTANTLKIIPWRTVRPKDMMADRVILDWQAG